MTLAEAVLPEMKYRRFGRTELQMPVFSTGGMRYQDGWQDKPLDEIPDDIQQNLEATIQRSVALGLNHIETARAYGPSERQLGLVLPKFQRDELIVQTKVVPQDDADQFTRDFEESLERLQLDHVDLLSIHGINEEEGYQQSCRKGGCFDAAQKLRERGLVKYIGFSTHGPVDWILKTLRHGSPTVGEGFDYVNLHWYFIMQRNWPCIQEAAERDMGVFIISPTDKGGKLYAPPDKLNTLCRPLHPIVFNDLFCLSHPEVHTLSLGASRPSDFDLHLHTLPLLDDPKKHLEPVLQRLGEAMKEAVGVEDPEAYSRQLPEPDDCIEGLNLQVMLWLRNLALGWGMTEYGKMRFNLLGNAGHWFPGAKPDQALALITDDQLREAIGDVPFVKDAPAWIRESFRLLGGTDVKRQSES